MTPDSPTAQSGPTRVAVSAMRWNPRTDNSITNERSDWYRVRRPGGRLSSFRFGSRIRAAEHVMRAAKVDDWRLLADRGVRIVSAA